MPRRSIGAMLCSDIVREVLSAWPQHGPLGTHQSGSVGGLRPRPCQPLAAVRMLLVCSVHLKVPSYSS